MEKLAERGFTLLEQQVFPTPYNARLIAAMVAFGPPGTTADDIVEALADCAEVKQVLPIFLKDFPTIKSGKYSVMLKPRGEGLPEEVLPAYITLHRHRASLFYAGRIPSCPYCNSATHLGRGCPHKGQKKCFHCNEFGHFRAQCPNIIQPDNVENTPSGEASAGPTSKNNTNIVAVAKDSTPVENSAELFTPPPASDNATTADHDSSQDSDQAGSTSSTHEESPERLCSRSFKQSCQANKPRRTKAKNITLFFFFSVFKTFHIASLNVRGLKNLSKRDAIFGVLRPFDIIFIQETHSTALDEIIYSREWRGASYWSHCDSRSAGTAIVFSNKFQPTISQIVRDDNGRYIIVIIESVDNIPYVLCNLYAPSGGMHKSLRKEFF